LEPNQFLNAAPVRKNDAVPAQNPVPIYFDLIRESSPLTFTIFRKIFKSKEIEREREPPEPESHGRVTLAPTKRFNSVLWTLRFPNTYSVSCPFLHCPRNQIVD
jgi:hypothetical protein